MDEQGISERSIPVTGHYLPDLIVRDLDRLRSEPFNGLQLRLGSVIGNYCSTRNAVLPSLPSQGLRHVSRATRVYSTRLRLLPCERDRVGGTSNLERACRLQILQLQIDFPFRIVNVQPHNRSAYDEAMDPFTRAFYLNKGNGL